MQLLPDGWHVPYGFEQCKNLNASFACDFDLYSNSNPTGLADDAKLAPNPDITGDLASTPMAATLRELLTCIADIQVVHLDRSPVARTFNTPLP